MAAVMGPTGVFTRAPVPSPRRGVSAPGFSATSPASMKAMYSMPLGRPSLLRMGRCHSRLAVIM